MTGEQPLDEELVRRVQQGDKQAFDILVRRYQYKIAQLIHRYIKDPQEALDVAQDSFIKAYRALPSFSRRERLLYMAVSDRDQYREKPYRHARAPTFRG